MIDKERVLFLCTGNTARSQMAEGFLRHYAGDRFEVHSAGLEPGVIRPLTLQVMEEAGVPLKGAHAKGVEIYLGKVHFHYLITVCDNAEKNCPAVWPGVNQRLHWSFKDPAAFAGSYEERLQRFREVRDQIAKKVIEWINEK
ncbi:MAG TPA: arsenate reductase ArsC [Anaerolineaceae bacterium]|nr:arsenate reductase ArsC [Anaerolineaceae bacterium]